MGFMRGVVPERATDLPINFSAACPQGRVDFAIGPKQLGPVGTPLKKEQGDQLSNCPNGKSAGIGAGRSKLDVGEIVLPVEDESMNPCIRSSTANA
jgi:hypothetical protein